MGVLISGVGMSVEKHIGRSRVISCTCVNNTIYLLGSVNIHTNDNSVK